MPKKLTNQRRCVGCKKVQDKCVMIRVVRTPAGNLIVDPTGKAAGHGAYLCKNSACLKVAKKKKRFTHALKMDIPNDLFDTLAAQIVT